MMDADMEVLHKSNEAWNEESCEPEEGELPVDMFQTRDAIVIRALVAGVNPEDLDIAITTRYGHP